MLFNLVKNVDSHENIVSALELDSSVKDSNIIFTTKNGMVKVSKVSEYFSTKHLISAIKLGKNDEVISVELFNPNKKLSMFTSAGNAVKIDTSDLSITGRVSSGVKGIALDKQDYVVSSMQTAISDAFCIFMSDGTAKIVKQNEVTESERNRKGLNFINTKAKNIKIVFVNKLSTKTNYVVETEKGKLIFLLGNVLPLDTRVGAGKVIVKDKIKKIYPFNESK